MARRKSKTNRIVRRSLLALAALPLLYLGLAVVGSLVPVNRAWTEPEEGITIYLADNGIHADLVLPVRAAGLDWEHYLSRDDVASAPADAQWIAFGAGERRIYLDTPTWWDLTPRTVWAALTRGKRVVHVSWVADPTYSAKAIRLRPHEYRRLWSAIRAEFDRGESGRPQQIDHPGYGPTDAFYDGLGKASAVNTCNTWAADRLRIAGVKTSLWSPFVDGLVWRYREAGAGPTA
ncbi:TIGR02117 family protein [Sphingomonas sp. HDW15A]|uniref:TIGR02117 family protein n=1 Tax=Sphingomonas sp. HDW15A TaxID=2714942 RepID=UPI0014082476|nr:TIGR02117 family protein [Sphingomonas sp. HDW15A]QIK96715.1 TIGR02117 family protein [Sphingomonas sp. HDW15A]